jgi:hypothetical protein
MALSAQATAAYSLMQQSPFFLLAQVETGDQGLVAQVVDGTDTGSSTAIGLYIAPASIIDELALAGHIRPHVVASEHYIYVDGAWVQNPQADVFIDPTSSEIPATEINRGTLYELTGV